MGYYDSEREFPAKVPERSVYIRVEERRKIMKKLTLLFGMAALAFTVTACTGKTAETAPAAAETEKAEETMASYESRDGWKTTQGSAFTVKEDNEHQVSFIYNTENPDKSQVIISYHPGKMPSEVLGEKTADIDDSRITRDEGYSGGLAPNWTYIRRIAEDPETGLTRQLNGTEHNGGTLLVDIYFYRTGDDDETEMIGDNITGLLDTLKFTSHEPQQELAYNVGTYERKYKEEIEGKEQEFTDTIILNDDHTGTLSFQDDIRILWGSYELTEVESSSKYEFKVEGDSLFLNREGTDEWLEFTRKK